MRSAILGNNLKCTHDDRCKCSHSTTRKKTWKNFQALNRVLTHNLCVTGAMPSQLSYQSHVRAVVCGLALYVQWTPYSAQVHEFHGNSWFTTVAIKCRHDYRCELQPQHYWSIHDRSHVALIAQLVEHCTGNSKVVGFPQSLKTFSGNFPAQIF